MVGRTHLPTAEFTTNLRFSRCSSHNKKAKFEYENICKMEFMQQYREKCRALSFYCQWWYEKNTMVFSPSLTILYLIDYKY